ncbi:PP2C family protein-serine/threonine phosphatase [Actinoallomurus rhizosphaericola]|uniref:PP2C family protein-serine/threonine phosphatase n=1 Tax=Actinoallomurus rhizosphaericola TaxID=2952536 RepID=UPI0020914B11|nr:PP2C family protein-serine/threonine phosphatase [Actinoallomurus rhizosphaericola]MCO5992952.1 serine/threonine-protein phosphatase [Actinoallomurus rhizosphaericola]
MRVRRRLRDLRREARLGHVLVAVPLALIVIITVVDVLTPESIHLRPLLVVAPALTASFAGSRWTAAIGTLALVAGVAEGLEQHNLNHPEQWLEMLAIVAVSAFVVVFCAVRERHELVLHRVRSVSEITQQVLLRPLPREAGPLRIASLYLAAAAEARIGGDLYGATRTADGTRLLIGDVRGKGLTAISEAAAVLCAFREASHEPMDLCRVALRLEAGVCQDLVDHAETEPNADECFVTACVIDLPDAEPKAELISCGHPPPLLLRGDRVLTLQPDQVAPPLGLELLAVGGLQPTTFSFEPGDVLLLYTDGVIEARDRTGVFFDLPAHLSLRAGEDVDTLVERLRRDLFDHVGGRLEDDTAMIAIARRPMPAHA